MVGGRAWLDGGTVTVVGNVGRELKAAGGEIIVASTIGGDVELHAESIEIQPSAVINGDITYSAPQEAVIHEGARIEGAVNWHKLDLRRDFGGPGWGFAGTLAFFLEPGRFGDGAVSDISAFFCVSGTSVTGRTV